MADTKRKFYDVAHVLLHFFLHLSLFMMLLTFHDDIDVSYAPFSTGVSAASRTLEADWVRVWYR